MAQKSLRRLVDKASSQLSQLKNPDVSEAQARLHEVLMAAQIGGIQHNHLTSIEERGGMLVIDSTYPARGHTNTADHEIPLSVIDAKDPVAAARRWGAEQRVAKAEADVGRTRGELERYEARLVAAKSDLAAIPT